jgi:hypothetical protein
VRLRVLADMYRLSKARIYKIVSDRSKKTGLKLRERRRDYIKWIGVDVSAEIINQIRLGELSRRAAAKIVCCSRRTIQRRIDA